MLAEVNFWDMDLLIMKRKRVFIIPDKYEIVSENRAQSCAAILAEHIEF